MCTVLCDELGTVAISETSKEIQLPYLYQHMETPEPRGDIIHLHLTSAQQPFHVSPAL